MNREQEIPDTKFHEISLPIIIRAMKIDDIPMVLEIDKISFSLPWPESAYRYELCSNPLSRMWVAEVDQGFGECRLAGMIVLWLIEGEAHIATLAVHSDYRRERIGTRLLAFALQDAWQQGACEAMLEVRKSNQAAQMLYQKFGFEVINRRVRYYKDNHEDALLMNLFDLNQAIQEINVCDSLINVHLGDCQ